MAGTSNEPVGARISRPPTTRKPPNRLTAIVPVRLHSPPAAISPSASSSTVEVAPLGTSIRWTRWASAASRAEPSGAKACTPSWRKSPTFVSSTTAPLAVSITFSCGADPIATRAPSSDHAIFVSSSDAPKR